MRDNPKFGPATTAEEAAQDMDLRGKTALVAGVESYALDVNADRPWDASERLVGERFAPTP